MCRISCISKIGATKYAEGARSPPYLCVLKMNDQSLCALLPIFGFMLWCCGKLKIGTGGHEKQKNGQNLCSSPHFWVYALVLWNHSTYSTLFVYKLKISCGVVTCDTKVCV